MVNNLYLSIITREEVAVNVVVVTIWGFPATKRVYGTARKISGISMEPGDSNTYHVDWLAGRLLPAFQSPQELTVYSVRDLDYDLQLSIATLVGLVNRSQNCIYLNWRGYDLFWLQEALGHIPSTVSPLSGEAILADIVNNHRDQVAGYVIYDPSCIDSVNIATMIGAQRDGFVVSPTIADVLLKKGYQFPVIDDLRERHWSSRAQIYDWALKNLFANAQPGLIAGLDPKIALGIRPYLVATKTFIYWLHPLASIPRKSQGWHSERSVLKTILQACAPGTIHLGWFLQEGSGVTLTSQQAIPVIASDLFSNLEIWSGAANSQIVYSPPRSSATMKPQQKVYVSFTMSEGDNLQYIQERMIQHWHDPERGTIPIGWPMALILPQAAPAMWQYYIQTASENDEFIAGPSGLGYSYPSKWSRSYLASYLQQSGLAMQRMGLDVLEILDSNFWWHPFLMHRAITKGAGMALINRKLQQLHMRELQSYAVKGILSGGGLAQGNWLFGETITTMQNVGIAGSVEQAVDLIRQATKKHRPYFINVYVLAWRMGPTELKEVVTKLGSEYEIVTPGTLLRMVAPLSNGLEK